MHAFLRIKRFKFFPCANRLYRAYMHMRTHTFF